MVATVYSGFARGNVVASASAVSHTGDTTLTTLAIVTVPANSLGPNGFLRITTIWSWTNNANLKTMSVKLGSTAYYTRSESTGLCSRVSTEIHNVNSTSSQKGGPAGLAGGFGSVTGSPVTTSLDTTADQTITFTVQLANAADSAVLESYIVEAFYSN